MKLPFVLFTTLVFLLAGCTVPSPGRVATKTVSLAGSVTRKTTVTAVKTSTHVAVATSGSAVRAGVTIVRTPTKAPMIIFKDSVTGVVKHVPYSDGLRLYAASQTAQLQMGLKTFQLVRNGTPVMRSAWSKVKAGTISDPVLHPGDIVQIGSVQKLKTANRL